MPINKLDGSHWEALASCGSDMMFDGVRGCIRCGGIQINRKGWIKEVGVDAIARVLGKVAEQGGEGGRLRRRQSSHC